MSWLRSLAHSPDSIKYVAVGTGVVTLAYLSYKYLTWSKSHRSWLEQLQLINSRLKVTEILVVENDSDWPMVITRLKSELSVFKVLGLDGEWIPGDKNPVALLQLATHSGLVILLRLCALQSIPQEFKTLMSDKGILKLGVGILKDALKLGQDHEVCVRGCVDLRHLAKRQRKRKIGKCGLSALSLTFLGFPLVKIRSITCSNWEETPLSDKQIQYAAADALVAIRIFMKIMEDKYDIRSEEQPEKLTWQKALSICQGIVDVKYVHNHYENAEEVDFRSIFDKLNGEPQSKPSQNNKPSNSSKVRAEATGRAYSARKKPLYENCQLRAPDGQLLCTCDSKKAKWYVEKGLGKQIGDNPITIELLFEPSGRPKSERNYYLQDKENVCVVCGSLKLHNRKNIVPHEYRKYFPPVMKEHRSHDVLPLCTACHQRSNLYDNALKQHYAKKCDAPMATEKGLKYHMDQELRVINSAARALLKSKKLPSSRREELEQIVCSYFGVNEVNERLLEDASNIDAKVPNGEFTPHGWKVIEYVTAHEGLLEFEKTWRQHFLDSMKPKYLYPGWSVDHSHEELQDLNKGMHSAIGS